MKVTIRQTITRLKHLERVMREVAKKPKVAFKMGTWGFKWDKDDEDRPPCGTSACCAGWAGLDPAIRRMGLRTRLGKWGLTEIVCKGAEAAWGGNYGAAQSFFGITDDETSALFHPLARKDVKTASQKAKQVAALRKTYEKRLRATVTT